MPTMIGTRAYEIASVCHEANRAYCETIEDFSQPNWAAAPDWQKSSAFEGVRQIMEHPETTPKQSHEGWLRVKRDAGWVYGKTRDPDAKTHPCMVKYGDLPESQRTKDRLFGAIVRALIGQGAC